MQTEMQETDDVFLGGGGLVFIRPEGTAKAQVLKGILAIAEIQMHF